VEEGLHGLSVAAANASARTLGISSGLGFTDARARCPDLLHEDINRNADRDALEKIAGWMIRLSPLVALDGPDALMIETTGCDHLHGGEKAMMKQVSDLLERDAIPHRLGLASTPGAAHALARGRPGHILADGREADDLSTLPISALRLSEEAETLLKRFGLRRIGQLYGIDRKALGRRFQSKRAADAVLLRLDQALGLRHEPVRPLKEAPAYTSRLPCAEPLLAIEGVTAGLETLAEDLCETLTGSGQGARAFSFHAFRADGEVSSASITLSRPVRTPSHVLRLFDEKLDQIDPGFGIDLLMLEARRIGPMETSAPALSSDLAASDTDPVMLAALADRVTAKLGEGAVMVMDPVASHLPEKSERAVPFNETLLSLSRPPARHGPRPLRLIDPPEEIKVLAEVPDGPPLRFIWRRVPHAVTRADGPERLAPEWWTWTAPPPAATSPEGLDRKWLNPKLDKRADAALIERIRAELEESDPGELVSTLPRARDYYRIEDTDGRRYWLFRQGLYEDGRGGAPTWFMHGLFP
jgi:protein ImuB